MYLRIIKPSTTNSSTPYPNPSLSIGFSAIRKAVAPIFLTYLPREV